MTIRAMERKIKIVSTSNKSATVREPYVLSETSTTRMIVRAELVDNESDPEAGCRINIVAQKKSQTGDWEDTTHFKQSKMRAGEEVRMVLKSGATKKLLAALEELRKIQNEYGIPWGQREVVVSDSESIVQISDSELVDVLRDRLNNSSAEELTQILSEASSTLLSQIAETKLLQERRDAVQKFEEMMRKSCSEQDWQSFFSSNQWIFGLGLCYHFLGPVSEQPPYLGAAYDRSGSQRGDFLMATDSESSRFTVLVEIKKPNTVLFNDIKHRNGVELLSSELTGGVSQVQVNCRSWNIETSRNENNRSLEADHKIYTCEPKGLLVIGHTNQCGDSRDKRNTFELYRRNLHNPEVLTFDEVLRRAQFIVGGNSCTEPVADTYSDNDDVPF